MTTTNTARTPSQILTEMAKLEQELKGHGYNTLRCSAFYGEDPASSPHFSTHVSVTARPAVGVSENHGILDCIRELVEQTAEIDPVKRDEVPSQEQLRDKSCMMLLKLLITGWSQDAHKS